MLRAVPGGGAVVVEGRAPSAQRSQLVFGCRPEWGWGGGGQQPTLPIGCRLRLAGGDGGVVCQSSSPFGVVHCSLSTHCSLLAVQCLLFAVRGPCAESVGRETGDGSRVSTLLE